MCSLPIVDQILECKGYHNMSQAQPEPNVIRNFGPGGHAPVQGIAALDVVRWPALQHVLSGKILITHEA